MNLVKICVLSFLIVLPRLGLGQQMNDGLDTGIPGIYLNSSWTFQGIGTIKFQYEYGYICYKTSGKCYSFNASLSFRQVGSTFFGQKIYIDTFLGGGSVWLDGFNHGGIKVDVDNFDLPFSDYESDIYFEHSPDYWVGDDS